jgi:hypothetical protein
LLHLLSLTLSFHTDLAAVFNFLTWNAAYSLYPRSTFEHSVSLSVAPIITEKVKAAFLKYIKRGFEIHCLVPNDCTLFGPTYQYVGDRCTWRMHLPLHYHTDIDQHPTLTFIEANSWEIDYSIRTLEYTSSPRIRFMLFGSSTFHCIYTASLFTKDNHNHSEEYIKFLEKHGGKHISSTSFIEDTYQEEHKYVH